jgi:hypothetical protein
MPLLKPILSKICTAILLITVSIWQLRAQAPVKREYQIKAAFLFNFCQFVEWPPDAFASAEAPFVIGVYGNNPFGHYLEETVAGEDVNGHPVVVKYFNSVDNVDSCQILFVSAHEKSECEQVLSALKGKAVLTIGDAPYFLAQNGMIKFFTRNNSIKFQINLEETKTAGLVLSSKLLRLAEIYEPAQMN